MTPTCRTTPTTVGRALSAAVPMLAEAGINSARLDAELLLAESMGLSRQDLFSQPDRALDDAAGEQFARFLERRRSREPVAGILGRREFWSMDFKITPDVLIPRPETESLIEALLSLAQDDPSRETLRLLDIGTGSGILAIVAARELPHGTLQAVDLCPRALVVARHNAQQHEVADRIEFIQADLRPGLGDKVGTEFDYILSNPPYIPTAKIDHLMPEVRAFEPRLALDGGVDGLDFYRLLATEAARRLKPSGGLILEIGEDQGPAVQRLLEEEYGFDNIATHCDLGGRTRVVTARRPNHGQNRH